MSQLITIRSEVARHRYDLVNGRAPVCLDHRYIRHNRTHHGPLGSCDVGTAGEPLIHSGGSISAVTRGCIVVRGSNTNHVDHRANVVGEPGVVRGDLRASNHLPLQYLVSPRQLGSLRPEKLR